MGIFDPAIEMGFAVQEKDEINIVRMPTGCRDFLNYYLGVAWRDKDNKRQTQFYFPADNLILLVRKYSRPTWNNEDAAKMLKGHLPTDRIHPRVLEYIWAMEDYFKVPRTEEIVLRKANYWAFKLSPFWMENSFRFSYVTAVIRGGFNPELKTELKNFHTILTDQFQNPLLYCYGKRVREYQRWDKYIYLKDIAGLIPEIIKRMPNTKNRFINNVENPPGGGWGFIKIFYTVANVKSNKMTHYHFDYNKRFSEVIMNLLGEYGYDVSKIHR